MARLVFPDESSQLVYRISGQSLMASVGATATVYTTAAATTLADLRVHDGTATPGAIISGSVLTVDSSSRLPLFWGPDGVDTVYVKVNDGPVTAVYARTDDRFDALAAAATPPAPPPDVFTRDAANARVYPANYTSDHLIIGSNQINDAGGTDRDKRMFFHKTEGAFRAGEVTGTNWDTASLGANSAAFGKDSRASGTRSFAANSGTATADGASAFGAASAGHLYALALGTSTANGMASLAGGVQSAATADYSYSFGYGASASGYTSVATGLYSSATRHAQQSHAGMNFSVVGDAQANRFPARRSTTDATPTVLLFDGGTFTSNAVTRTGVNTNVLTIPASRAHRFTLTVVARRTDSTSDAGGWTITGTIVRGATGSATFVSTPTVVADLTAGASSGGWNVGVSINTTDATNNYLAITATGQAAATIRWVADLSTTEVG